MAGFWQAYGRSTAACSLFLRLHRSKTTSHPSSDGSESAATIGMCSGFRGAEEISSPHRELSRSLKGTAGGKLPCFNGIRVASRDLRKRGIYRFPSPRHCVGRHWYVQGHRRSGMAIGPTPMLPPRHTRVGCGSCSGQQSSVRRQLRA
jgi:hypothetical protein